jgi:hypothetical protein
MNWIFLMMVVVLVVIGIFKLGSERTAKGNVGTGSVHDKIDDKYANDDDKKEANDDYIPFSECHDVHGIEWWSHLLKLKSVLGLIIKL